MSFWYIILGLVIAYYTARRFKPYKNVAGKVILITGGGSGLGRLLAHKFAKKKAKIVIWDINKEGADAVVEECRKLGSPKVLAQKVDLSQRSEVYSTAEATKKEMGNVDIVVNNAGIVSGKSLLDCPDALIEKTMQVNTHALFWTTKAFLPDMIAQNYGHIVTVSSCAGLVGVVGLSDYCASKSGAFGFDESLRYELAKKNITGVKTTVVCPFYINTGMFDGVKTRFSFLLPILDQDYAVDQMFRAILQDNPQLIMPIFSSFLFFARGIMPTVVFDAFMTFLGVNATMDQFKGRVKSE